MSPGELNITTELDDLELTVDPQLPEIELVVDSPPSVAVETPSTKELNITIEAKSTDIKVVDDQSDIDVTIESTPDVIVFPTLGSSGPPGPPGSPGPPGPPGPEGQQTTYTFTQLAPTHLWDIIHNLNRYPSVTVIDSGGSEIIPTIIYVSNNYIQLQFDNVTSGKAYLN